MYRPVGAAAESDRLAVELAERNRQHRAVSAPERVVALGALGEVPDAYRPVVAAADRDRLAVELAEGHRRHRPGVAGERRAALAA